MKLKITREDLRKAARGTDIFNCIMATALKRQTRKSWSWGIGRGHRYSEDGHQASYKISTGDAKWVAGWHNGKRCSPRTIELIPS